MTARTRDRHQEREPHEHGSRIGAIAYFALGFAALAIIGYVVFTWLTGEDAAQVQDNSAGVDLGITLSEIAEQPLALSNEVVVVSGDISEVISLEPTAFVVGEDLSGNNGQVLVLSNDVLQVPGGGEPDPTALVNDLVQVQGVVRNFSIAEIEDDLGVDLDDNTFSEFEGDPVILAMAIDLFRGVPIEPEAAVEGQQIGEPLAIGTDAVIGEAFGRLEGHRVIGLSEVQNVLNPTAYVSEADVLVVNVGAEVPLLVGVNTLVTGTVRTFDLIDIEAITDTDLNDETFEQFEGEPVVIADEIIVLTPIDQIAENPAAFAGLEPTILAEISQVFGPHVFAVSDGDLLVVVEASDEGPVELASVLAQGTLVSFNLIEVETELGVELDDAALEGWEGRPAIIAAEAQVIR